MWKMSKAELALVFGLALAATVFAGIHIASGLPWRRGGITVVHREAAPSVKVDVNSAPWWEIAWLPGIGERKAKAIVEYRQEHGPFVRGEDLARVPGISQLMVDRMKDQIIFSDHSPGTPAPAPSGIDR